MSSKNGSTRRGENGNEKRARRGQEEKTGHRLHPDTKRSVWAVVLGGLALILILAGFNTAGPAGAFIFNVLDTLLGWGYFILPVSLLLLAVVFVTSERQRVVGVALLGSGLLVLSVLGIIEMVTEGHGGWLGLVFGSLQIPFGKTAALVIAVVALLIALLVTVNVPIRIRWERREKPTPEPKPPVVTGQGETKPELQQEPEKMPEKEEAVITGIAGDESSTKSEEKRVKITSPKVAHTLKNYIAPPLSLLRSSTEKPLTGDLRANANIIKRTLESFGINVEMSEINIGPTVTRYTLKPAEGVKLSRILALSQDLALSLAAHPIRIEAPIPGKSLVGIEVPNKAAALVHLGSIMGYPEFNSSGALSFVVGRDVNGAPLYADISKMPHLLIAGATGSGKSVTIQSLLISLLYKNGPAHLKMILVDPKRVELSIYDGLPHLVSPVITENKKAVGVFRWAIKEMDRRYDLLLGAGKRDIMGYNKTAPEEPIPYLLIVVDELADLMSTYGKEVEGSIIRLAQMARATGIHLVLSTQRPSVEVITGLIKANITSRLALQVASQIDSRTILDNAGAEKLLGHGDLLFISSEFSKPKRIQGAYISEEEVHKVIDFIKEHNDEPFEGEGVLNFPNWNNGNEGVPAAAGTIGSPNDYEESDENDDELYQQALEVVVEAKKASASLLQRRLKVGYARAARLLDLMEMKGVIGPGDGAKPREVYIDQVNT